MKRDKQPSKLLPWVVALSPAWGLAIILLIIWGYFAATYKPNSVFLSFPPDMNTIFVVTLGWFVIFPILWVIGALPCVREKAVRGRWLPPMYLWRRAKSLGKSKASAIIWIVLFCVAVVVLLGLRVILNI